MGATLASIENAPVALQPLSLAHSFVTPAELSSRLAAHYRRQALSQIYVILGASDIIGNPVGVLSSLRNGVRDFIMKPWRGLAKWSPGAFGAGVAMGTLSLARASLHGVAYGTTRALLALTRGTIAGSSVVGAVDTHLGGQRLRPTGLLDGMRLAVIGLVTEPDRGFRTNGFMGLSRGLGAGMLGVLLKPTVGALSQLGGMTAALAASLDPAFDREAKLRMHRERPPRFFRGSEARLLPYRSEENRGEELINRLRQGRHRGEGHVFHCEVQGGMTILVTRCRLMLLHTSKTDQVDQLFLGVEWEVPLDQILSVAIAEDDPSSDAAADYDYLSTPLHSSSSQRQQQQQQQQEEEEEEHRRRPIMGGVTLIYLPTSPCHRRFGRALNHRNHQSDSAFTIEEYRDDHRSHHHHGGDDELFSLGLSTVTRQLVCAVEATSAPAGGYNSSTALGSAVATHHQAGGHDSQGAQVVARSLVRTLVRLAPALSETQK
jgi:hypothetical protein